MASGYTPGLTVSARTTIAKTRRLSLKGQVLVARGERVQPETVVARAELPGIMQTVKVAERLGIEPADVAPLLSVTVGDPVERGQVIARTKGFWGLFSAEAKATTSGKVELIAPHSGHVGIREAPTPIEVNAYIPGEVTETLPGEGVVVTTRGALVQGIFGVGGERRAPLRALVSSPEQPLTEGDIPADAAGSIVLGGSVVTGAALRRAAQVGVVGVVTGGIVDTDLADYLGYDIGVAITGHEEIPLTLVLTEGFGQIAMATRTFDLLASLTGRPASLCGATQIRAGVIRPEIIVADEGGTAAGGNALPETTQDFSLSVGAAIRIIREPYFGLLATVSALPTALTTIDSGAEVRVLEAQLVSTGQSVTVPRANVEIVAG